MDNVRFRFGDNNVILAPWHTCTHCALHNKAVELYDCCPVLTTYNHADDVLMMRCYEKGWCINSAHNFCMISLENNDTLVWRINMMRQARKIISRCKYNQGR